MKKLSIITLVALTVLISVSSCSYEVCPTYATSSLKKHGPKYSYAHSKPNKKQKKNMFY